MAPDATLFGRLSTELSLVVRRSLWAPALALSVARGATRQVPTLAGDAELTWTTGRLDACVIQLPMTVDSTWGVRLCPIFEAGVLYGTAPGAFRETSQTRGWTAAGGLGRFTLTLPGPFALEVEAAVDAPIKRYHFFFSPNTEVYRVPAASLSGSAGLAARFW